MQNRKRDTDVQNRLWTLWEMVRVGCFERTACILSIVKQITSPGGMHETSARSWCTGKTQRNRVEREGGSGWGTHVTPWLIHVNVWQNPLQCCEVISLQLIKINEKKSNHFISLSCLVNHIVCSFSIHFLYKTCPLLSVALSRVASFSNKEGLVTKAIKLGFGCKVKWSIIKQWFRMVKLGHKLPSKVFFTDK